AVTVVTPDAGGGKLMARFASYLRDHDIDPEMAYIDKRRPKGTHNVARAQEVVGLVKDRTCVLVDDMIDTAGTITSAAELLTDRRCRHARPSAEVDGHAGAMGIDGVLGEGRAGLEADLRIQRARR